MAKKPQKPTNTTDPIPPITPEDLIEDLPFDQLMKILATVAGKSKGLAGEDIRQYIASVQTQVQTVAQQVENDARDDAARKAAAAQIETLLDTVARTGTAIGKAIEPHRDEIAGAIQRADLSKVGDALQLLAAYLQSPDDEAKERAQKVIGELEQTLGPLVGYDPEREDAERRAQIRRDVKQKMDAIFAARPMPKIEFKAPPKPGSDDDKSKK